MKRPNHFLLVFTIALFMNIFISKIAWSNPSTQTNPTRKKNTATIIFQGLAQSCVHAGQIVVAEEQKEKQQGVLNVLGTFFNVASQLAAPTKSETESISMEEQQETIQKATKQLTQLTRTLLDALKQESQKSIVPLPPTLNFINALPSLALQEEQIANILSSSPHSRNYLEELFSTLQSYLAQYLPQLIQSFKESIASYVFSSTTEEEAAKDETSEKTNE